MVEESILDRLEDFLIPPLDDCFVCGDDTKFHMGAVALKPSVKFGLLE
jgi:hypothetical protein